MFQVEVNINKLIVNIMKLLQSHWIILDLILQHVF